MPLKLKDLKDLHDKAYTSGQTNRERASDDLVFYWVTHWDDALTCRYPNGFQGRV